MNTMTVAAYNTQYRRKFVKKHDTARIRMYLNGTCTGETYESSAIANNMYESMYTIAHRSPEYTNVHAGTSSVDDSCFIECTTTNKAGKENTQRFEVHFGVIPF